MRMLSALFALLLGMAPAAHAGNPFGGLKDFFATVPKSTLDEAQGDHGKPDIARDIAAWRRGGQTFADMPYLHVYLQQIADRLLGDRDTGERTVQIMISPPEAFGAFTLPNGAVFVNLGTLLALRSEDEVAALLGHELAHVLLRHHESDEYRNLLDKGFRFAELYMSSQGGKFGQNDFRKLQAASWVSQKALFPAWTRQQEDAADRKGLELMIAAGYNADAMVRLLRVVQKATERQRQALKAARPDEALRQMAQQVERELSTEHKSAEARLQQVRTLLKTELRKRPRPALRRAAWQQALDRPSTREAIARYRRGHVVDRLVAAGKPAAGTPEGQAILADAGRKDAWLQMLALYLALERQDGDRALQALRQAHASGKAPYITYRILAELAVKQGDYTLADRYLNELNEAFDWPPQTLPLTIHVNRKLKRFLLPLQMRCVATADKQLINSCNVAATR